MLQLQYMVISAAAKAKVLFLTVKFLAYARVRPKITLLLSKRARAHFAGLHDYESFPYFAPKRAAFKLYKALHKKDLASKAQIS